MKVLLKKYGNVNEILYMKYDVIYYEKCMLNILWLKD